MKGWQGCLHRLAVHTPGFKGVSDEAFSPKHSLPYSLQFYKIGSITEVFYSKPMIVNHMHFDKAAYKMAKERIVCLIKKNLPDWESTEGFIADGVICPDVYEKQPIRILCVLAESYGYDGDGMTDIENQPTDDIMGLRNSTVKTPRRLACLLYLLQLSIERGAKVTPEEWLQVPDLVYTINEENTAILQEALSKVAWINVKKASNGNGTKLDAAEGRSHARKNEAILREQILAIAPDLIIVCGQVAFSSLLEMGLLGPLTVVGRGWQIQESGNGLRVIEISHPAYFEDWNTDEKIYSNFEGIYAQVA